MASTSSGILAFKMVLGHYTGNDGQAGNNPAGGFKSQGNDVMPFGMV